MSTHHPVIDEDGYPVPVVNPIDLDALVRVDPAERLPAPAVTHDLEIPEHTRDLQIYDETDELIELFNNPPFLTRMRYAFEDGEAFIYGAYAAVAIGTVGIVSIVLWAIYTTVMVIANAFITYGAMVGTILFVIFLATLLGRSSGGDYVELKGCANGSTPGRWLIPRSLVKRG